MIDAMKDFNKEFFQSSWGENGYYETFSYGVGYKKVCEVGIYPFVSDSKVALEIGSGGGTFTQFMVNKFEKLTAIDVIKRPPQFNDYENFTYIELGDKDFSCTGIKRNSIDFCFAYNVFCHLSNKALTEYLKSVNRVMKKDGDFVFMLSKFSSRLVENINQYSLGDLLPMGHFYQDLRTLDIIVDLKQWDIVNNNLIPEHRDILVHLKKN